jgi:hypothetical protein
MQQVGIKKVPTLTRFIGANLKRKNSNLRVCIRKSILHIILFKW